MTPADDKARSPADQADRDRIVASRGANLLVEAGAGTGKTHLMVERVLHLVANEPDFRLRDIAAITFTERAAAELRSRIRERLLDEVRDTGDVRYRKALADLPLAAAGTIHAFAARIVREHPVEAGIAPGFAIDEGDDLAREVFSRWRAASVRDDPELWDTLLAFAPVDARQDAMFDLARAMLDHPDAFASIRAPESIDTVGEIGAVLQLANGILSLGDELGVDADDALYRATADACDVLRDLAALDADLLDDAVRRAKLPGRRGLGGKKGWGDRAEQAKGAGNALRDMFAIMQTRIGERIVLLAANAIVKFRDELWHARQTEGALSFTDLLSIARKILSEHKHVRAAEQARWRYILVDEFQDTDPTQVEFLRLLAGDKPGRVFYVGDPKQSIYRFRRADIEMYDDVRRTVGELAAIRVNFRCRPCVIDFVNGVFPEMMGRLAPPAQARYAPLEAHRDAALAGPGVAVLVGSAAAPGNEEADGANGAADNGEDNDPGLDAARRREAIAIADLIARIVAEKWQVEDRRERREATWRDIAVLYPKRTGIEYLDEEIARRGIPYASDMTRIFYTTREVRYLVQVLAAIARPHDRIALAAALASPFFAFSDADLAAWARSNGGLPWSGSIFDPQSSILDSIPGLADALTFLAELHRERDRAPIHRTIDRVLNETAALPFLHGDPRGAAIAAQLQTLRDRARLRQAEHRLTFGETVSWLVGELREAAEVNEKVEPDLLDDRVRLMTFHKAKGLEFPITIVANLSTRQASRGISPVLAVREGESVRHEFALGGFDGAKLETAGYGAASEHEKEMLRAEQVRQLYVACTRARDHLVVSWFPPIGPGRNESRYLDHFPAPLPELAASENPPGGLGLIVAAPPGAAPGILTLGGSGAAVKLWRREGGAWRAQTLWERDFGGRFSRMRDAEIGDLFGDGQPAIAVATHDQGVVAVIRPGASGFTVQE
ncbi:UvrD-helicase domain-containing protein, partial [bacterium]|nr:UvrD-helicase domain-containing protein [bacterium]